MISLYGQTEGLSCWGFPRNQIVKFVRLYRFTSLRSEKQDLMFGASGVKDTEPEMSLFFQERNGI